MTIVDSLLGRGFVRPVLNWKLEFRMSERENASLICKEIKQCFAKCGLTSVAKSVRSVDISVAMNRGRQFCAVKKKENRSQHIYAKYTAPMKSMVENGAVRLKRALPGACRSLPIMFCAWFSLCCRPLGRLRPCPRSKRTACLQLACWASLVQKTATQIWHCFWRVVDPQRICHD